MRILIVEDERKTAKYLQKGLAENGFVVDVLHSGADALHQLQESGYDLVILDVMLPGISGWDIVKGVRGAGTTTPILFLTARDAVEDRVKGLELGADDYLVKPFAFSELLARIRSLLRRQSAPLSEFVRVGDLELNLLQHKATRAGQRLNLTPKEFALLRLLARRHGDVVSRAVIAEQVWDMNFDSDTNVVDVAVRRVRQKVDDPFERKLIHTVRGVGYVLEER